MPIVVCRWVAAVAAWPTRWPFDRVAPCPAAAIATTVAMETAAEAECLMVRCAAASLAVPAAVAAKAIAVAVKELKIVVAAERIAPMATAAAAVYSVHECVDPLERVAVPTVVVARANAMATVAAVAFSVLACVVETPAVAKAIVTATVVVAVFVRVSHCSAPDRVDCSVAAWHRIVVVATNATVAAVKARVPEWDSVPEALLPEVARWVVDSVIASAADAPVVELAAACAASAVVADCSVASLVAPTPNTRTVA